MKWKISRNSPADIAVITGMTPQVLINDKLFLEENNKINKQKKEFARNLHCHLDIDSRNMIQRDDLHEL